jgi:hypothetical protein
MQLLYPFITSLEQDFVDFNDLGCRVEFLAPAASLACYPIDYFTFS